MRRAGFVACIWTVLLLILSGCTVTESSYYTGTVEYETYRVSSEVTGKVLEVMVAEGDWVEAGAHLLQVDTEALQLEKMRLLAELESLNAQLSSLETGARVQELAQLRIRLRQQDNRIANVKEDLGLKKDDYADAQVLQQAGAISDKEVEAREALVETAQNNLAASYREREVLAEQLALLEEGATDDEVRALAARIEAAQWGVKAIDRQMKTATVQAATAGRIERIYYQKGEYAPALKPLVKLADDQNLYVTIYVEERDLDKVAIGEKVRVLAASSNAEVTGYVSWIATEGEFTPKNLEARENRQAVVFETRIELEVGSSAFRPAMIVDVDLHPDKPGTGEVKDHNGQ